jgi:hypothetical protein
VTQSKLKIQILNRARSEKYDIDIMTIIEIPLVTLKLTKKIGLL